MSEETGGSFLTSGTPAGSGSAPPPDMSTAQGALDAVVDGPPEWVPQKYWDPDKREARYEEMGRGYQNLEKLLGREKIPMPLGEDDKEGWDRVYKAIGVPDKEDDYEFTRPILPTDLPYDEDGEKYLRKALHSARLNKKQSSEIYDKITKLQIERHSAWHEGQKKQRADLEHALIREYGQKIDAVKQSAHAVMGEYADPEFRQYLDETGLGNDPRMIRFMHKVAAKTGGETRLKGAPVQQGQPADLKRAVDEHFNKNKTALMEKTHPEHKRVLDERAKLFMALYPEGS